MVRFLKRNPHGFVYRLISTVTCLFFLGSTLTPPQYVLAQVFPQTVLNLPVPGVMVSPSPGFMPAIIKGVTLNPENPLQFDFIIDTGDSKFQGQELREEASKLVKYFLAALTVPEDELWVNLSPYEKDRMISQGFGDTTMGRDLLAQDYMLKQLTASLLYPEKELGKKFWDKVHQQAYEKYGVKEIPVDTFHKVWIVPDNAVIYEQSASAFIVQSQLKVMLEEDYLARDAAKIENKPTVEDNGKVTTNIIREIIIPSIEKEVNEGETFASLRQIYNAVILATWYKTNLKQSLLGQVYANQNKTKGVDTQDKKINAKIYDQYLEAFNKGVYNYIKENYDPLSETATPQQYFSGGTNIDTSKITSVWSRDFDGTLEVSVGGAFAVASPDTAEAIVSQGLQPRSPYSQTINFTFQMVPFGANADKNYLGTLSTGALVNVSDTRGYFSDIDSIADTGDEAGDDAVNTADTAMVTSYKTRTPSSDDRPVIDEDTHVVIGENNQVARTAAASLQAAGRRIALAFVLGVAVVCAGGCELILYDLIASDDDSAVELDPYTQPQSIDMTTQNIDQLREYYMQGDEIALWPTKRDAAIEIYRRFYYEPGSKVRTYDRNYDRNNVRDDIIIPLINGLNTEDPLTVNGEEYRKLQSLGWITIDALMARVNDPFADINIRIWSEKLLEYVYPNQTYITDFHTSYDPQTNFIIWFESPLSDEADPLYETFIEQLTNLIRLQPDPLTAAATLLAHDAPGVRMASAGALGDIGNADSLSNLQAALDVETNAGAHLAISEAMGVLLNADNIVNLPDIDLRLLLDSEYWIEVKTAAIEIVRRQTNMDDVQYVYDEVVTKRLEQAISPDPDTRNSIFYFELLGLGIDVVKVPAVSILEDINEDVNVRKWAENLVEELGQFNDLFPSLELIVNNSSDPLYDFAIDKISEMIVNYSTPTSKALELLDHSYPGVQIASAQALGEVGDVTTVPVLEAKRMAVSDADVIAAVENALNKILGRLTLGSYEETLTNLETIIANPDYFLYSAAKQKLKTIINSQFDPLGTAITLFDHPLDDIKIIALDVTGDISDMSSIPTLTVIRDTSLNTDVAASAEQAIIDIHMSNNFESYLSNNQLRKALDSSVWNTQLKGALELYLRGDEEGIVLAEEKLVWFYLQKMTSFSTQFTNLRPLGSIAVDPAIRKTNGERYTYTDAVKWAARLLGSIGIFDEVYEQLYYIAYSGKYRWWHETEASRGISDLKNRTSDAMLIKVLKESFSARNRFGAATYLGNRVSQGAIEVLMYAAENDFDQSVRIRSIRGLKALRNTLALPVLERIKQNSVVAEMITETEQAIAEIQASIVEMDALIAELSMADVTRKLEIISNFEGRRDLYVLGALNGLLNDGDAMVVTATERTIAILTDGIGMDAWDNERLVNSLNDSNAIIWKNAEKRLLGGRLGSLTVDQKLKVEQEVTVRLAKLTNPRNEMVDNEDYRRLRSLGRAIEPLLLVQIDDEMADRTSRRWAMVLLGEVGDFAMAMAKFEEILMNADGRYTEWTDRSVARALTELFKRQPISVIKQYVNDANVIIRRGASEGMLINAKEVDAIDFINLLSDSDKKVVLLAMKGLKKAVDKNSIPYLEEIRDNFDNASEIRTAADQTLKTIFSVIDVSQLTNAELRSYLDKKYWNVKVKASLELYLRGDEEGIMVAQEDIIWPYLQKMTSFSTQFDYLSPFVGIAVDPTIRKTNGERYTNTDAVKWAARLLGRVGLFDEVYEQLYYIAYSGKYRWWHETEASRGISDLKNRTSDAMLIKVLKESFSARNRFGAATYLGNRVSQGAIEVLMYAAENDFDQSVQIRAIRGLKALRNTLALPVLERIKQNSADATIITETEQAIAEIQASIVEMDALIAELSMADVTRKLEIISNFEGRRDLYVLGALNGLLNDGDVTVVTATERTIAILTDGIGMDAWDNERLVNSLNDSNGIIWKNTEKILLGRLASLTDDQRLKVEQEVTVRLARLTNPDHYTIDSNDYLQLRGLGSVVESLLITQIDNEMANRTSRRWAMALLGEVGEFATAMAKFNEILVNTDGQYTEWTDGSVERALTELFKRQSILTVTPYLQNSLDVIQLSAANALAGTGDVTVLPDLQALVDDANESPDVQAAAQAAINYINERALSSSSAATVSNADLNSLLLADNSVTGDQAQLTTDGQMKGGIDLNPDLLDLEIKKDPNGVPLSIYQQPILEMTIEGFVPVIINITPILSLPMFLGFADREGENQHIEGRESLFVAEYRERFSFPRSG